MEVVFYSLYDIMHENQSEPLFLHLKNNTDQETEKDLEDISDVIEFADNTMQEANELTKVRDYYFKSEETEIISQIKKMLNLYLKQETLSIEDIASYLKVISERYSNIEKEVIEKRSNINTPSPSNLFYVLGEMPSDDYESMNYLFFIAKIEKSEFLHSERDVFKLLKGLPHKNNEGKKSVKSWKTASIYFSTQLDEKENPILEIDRVIISDTNRTIASYWANNFLEATEVTDDEKNTLQAYNEVKRVINNLSREKDKTPNRVADITHFTSQLNGYFLNNEVFEFDEMVDHIFGSSYKPSCPNLDMDSFNEKFIRLRDSKKFDNNFSIIQSVVEDKTKQTFKVSEQIDIRINRHFDNIRDVITSEIDDLGKPYIKIKVDSKDNEAYINFINKNKIIHSS